MRWKYWSKWSISKESAWSKQTPVLFGTNLTWGSKGARPLFSWSYHNRKSLGRDSWRVTTLRVQSFVLISMLRGQPKTPPSGDDLAELNYHLKYEKLWNVNICSQSYIRIRSCNFNYVQFLVINTSNCYIILYVIKHNDSRRMVFVCIH